MGSTTVPKAAANASVLSAVLWVLGIGALILAPSLWLLYATFQRATPEE